MPKGTIESAKDLQAPEFLLIVIPDDLELQTSSGFFYHEDRTKQLKATIVANHPTSREGLVPGARIILDNGWAGSAFEWDGYEYVAVHEDTILAIFEE